MAENPPMWFHELLLRGLLTCPRLLALHAFQFHSWHRTIFSWGLVLLTSTFPEFISGACGPGGPGMWMPVHGSRQHTVLRRSTPRLASAALPPGPPRPPRAGRCCLERPRPRLQTSFAETCFRPIQSHASRDCGICRQYP